MNETSPQKEIRIVPSLLAADFARLENEIRAVEAAGCRSLHFDVMDGHFVPNLSFGPDLLAAVRRLTPLKLVAHLMVDNPGLFIEPFRKAGADGIIIHPEIGPDFDQVFRAIRETGAEAGAAVKPKTPLSATDAVWEELDFLLLMSVEPGFGGQEFIPGSEKKIAEARRKAGNRERFLPIGVDGGINLTTIGRAAAAGATDLIAGSAVFRGEATLNVRRLAEAARKGRGEKPPGDE